MAFTPIGVSTRLAVSAAGQNALIVASAPQCRIWNEGPNAARVRYGVTGAVADANDLIMPPGFIEVHTKSGASLVAAICAAGETAVLHIQAGAGD